MRLGAVDYLEKPFTSLGLVAQRVLSAIEHARTVYERAELAQALEQMRDQLRRSEDLAYERQTAVEVFDKVLARRLELATTQVTRKVVQLEAVLARGRQRAVELSGELGGSAQQKARELVDLLTLAPDGD
jgi:FixJ family two-component response regulator